MFYFIFFRNFLDLPIVQEADPQKIQNRYPDVS